MLRWATHPKRHYVVSDNVPPTINTPELRKELQRKSQEIARRRSGETLERWNTRRTRIARSRAHAKKRLQKLQGLADGMEILEDDRFTLLPVPFPDVTDPDERIAILAAIHDTYAVAEAQINPWREFSCVEDSDPSSLAQYVLFLRYKVLRDRVPELLKYWRTHEAAIEKFLADVERDLADLRRKTERRDKPQVRGRKKADFKTCQDEAQLADAWKKAHKAKVYKPNFARDHGMTADELNTILNRVYARNRRSDK